MLVFVYLSVFDKWFVDLGSRLFVMKIWYYWLVVNSYFDSYYRIIGSKWEEIGNWR